MIFDAHCDIWTDVTHHHLAGERDIFRRYHYERLKKGGITGGIFVIWNDPPYDKDPLKRTHQMMEAIAQEEKDCADILKVCRSFRDMDEAIKDGKMYAFIGLEGLKSIGEDVDRIDEFYQFGARHASLTWNEENPLATGARGNPDRGLTDLGRKAVRKIQDLGMILDMSHINDKSFWDLMSIATTPVIASHSNSRTVCPAKRNLTDDMLKEIAKTGGLVGMNSLREFVSEKREEQNVQKLCDHLDYIANLIGIDHIGLGYDFDDYLGGEALSSFSSNLDSPSADGVSNEAEAYNLILEMKKRGYSQEDCDKVAYKNFYRVFKQVLK